MTRTYPVEILGPEGTIRLEVPKDAYLLDALREAGLDLPGSCLQGWCLTCPGRLLAGEVDQADAARYFPEDREAGFFLLCTAKPRSPLRMVSHQRGACREHRLRLGLATPRG